MIRIDAVWLGTQPLDMRSGFDSCLARVIEVFGAAHPTAPTSLPTCVPSA